MSIKSILFFLSSSELNYLINITVTCIFFFRANASLNLENQIKKVDGLVSGFEKKLSDDGPILDVPNAIQARAGDIQVRE